MMSAKLIFACLGLISILFVKYIFRVFDEDGSGSLDFLEFTLAMNCTHLTNPEDKLREVFISLFIFLTSKTWALALDHVYLLYEILWA